MGNKQSFLPPVLPTPKVDNTGKCPPGCGAPPVNFAQAQKLVERATVAQGPSSCQVNDNKLNNARKDVRETEQEWEKCYPELALQRRLTTLREEANKYSTERQKERDTANANYNTKVSAVEKLARSAQEFYKILFEKEKELASLVGKRTNLEQLERRERRAFLDNDPQGGSGGAPGVRTTDDRVLLAFWITYGTALLSVTLFVLQLYGARLGIADGKTKATAVTIVGIVGYAVPYYFINTFG